jgi:hypothetical protein
MADLKDRRRFKARQLTQKSFGLKSAQLKAGD